MLEFPHFTRIIYLFIFTILLLSFTHVCWKAFQDHVFSLQELTCEDQVCKQIYKRTVIFLNNCRFQKSLNIVVPPPDCVMAL